MININIIPVKSLTAISFNYRNALGYCWADYKNKIPGNDIYIVEDFKNGIDWRAAAKAEMQRLGVTSAYINCMWCGGHSGEITAKAAPATAGETPAETAQIVKIAEQIVTTNQDTRNINNPGYCTICHSYCYGDCQAH